MAECATDPDNLIWVMPAEGSMRHDTVFVISGGPDVSLSMPDLPSGTPVIAADKGIDHALAVGIKIDVAVGDMDSVSTSGLAAVEASGARIVRHPSDKDATDLELALDEAAALDPRRMLVVCGGEGRLDHLLAEVLLLGADRYAAFEIDALLGSTRAHVIRSERVIKGRKGSLVSFLALHGPAEGVVTEGLVYPLASETLSPGSTRGVSNVFAGSEARVAIASGVLIALCPPIERNRL